MHGREGGRRGTKGRLLFAVVAVIVVSCLSCSLCMAGGAMGLQHLPCTVTSTVFTNNTVTDSGGGVGSGGTGGGGAIYTLHFGGPHNLRIIRSTFKVRRVVVLGIVLCLGLMCFHLRVPPAGEPDQGLRQQSAWRCHTDDRQHAASCERRHNGVCRQLYQRDGLQWQHGVHGRCVGQAAKCL